MHQRLIHSKMITQSKADLLARNIRVISIVSRINSLSQYQKYCNKLSHFVILFYCKDMCLVPDPSPTLVGFPTLLLSNVFILCCHNLLEYLSGQLRQQHNKNTLIIFFRVNKRVYVKRFSIFFSYKDILYNFW